MTDTLSQPGLRERKRIATHRAIQLAVLRQTVERGLERVTVDDVSREADVSPRTFFNYFGSKEDAIIGSKPVLPDSAAIELFVSGGPRGTLLGDVGELLASAAESAADDRDIMALRREVLKQYPELFAIRMANLKQLEDEITELVFARVRHDDRTSSRSEAALRRRAQLVTLVAFGTFRYAWICSADDDPASPFSSRVTEAFDELQALFTAEDSV